MINLICAMTPDGIIGQGNKLPWHIPGELQNFRELTLGHTVVMGRNTWDNIPGLDGRTNLVLSSKSPYLENQIYDHATYLFRNINDVLQFHREELPDTELFVIGGRDVYRQFFPFADRFYLSLIRKNYEGDVFFPFSLDQIKEMYPHVKEYEFRGDWDFLVLDRFKR